MAVILKGNRELELKFDQFPQQLHGRLEARITQLIDSLQARIEGARPVSPGKSRKLRSEVKSRVYSSQNRIAGYVSIYAPGNSGEYAKAAALEYGSNKPRRSFERVGRMASLLTRGRRRIVSRLSKPVHLEAYRYMRGPFEDSMSEFQAALETEVNEAVAE